MFCCRRETSRKLLIMRQVQIMRQSLHQVVAKTDGEFRDGVNGVSRIAEFPVESENEEVECFLHLRTNFITSDFDLTLLQND